MVDSVFTKIFKGELPGEIIYRDDICAVLMTIEPLTPGNCMVIPIKQIPYLWDVPDDDYQHLMMVTKKVGLALRQAYDYPRISIIVEGFDVAHTHIRVQGLNTGIAEALAVQTRNPGFATAEELKTEADKIRKYLVD